MYKLYHHILCPFSRKIRFLLSQKAVDFKLIEENFWERREIFVAINPMGSVPVLFDEHNRNVVCPSSTIAEYIEEKHDDNQNYFGNSLVIRAESRRLQSWLDEKFYVEVVKHLLNERYFNRFTKNPTSPNSENIRLAKNNLKIHLDYLEFLLENRKYLASDKISIADFSAAGHISSLDYFGDIDWPHRQILKEWYCLVKSQKGFGNILKDRVVGIVPPEYYHKLDF
ncbi:MAG: glutathione S-transferase [Lentimonas sp.]|jgi:glutathione S-transferase